MASDVVSMRVPEEAKARLERFSRFLGKKPSEAGAMLLEEGLRRLEHPYIDFRQTGIGRQAYLEGTRLAVWFIYQVAEGYHFDVAETARHFNLSPSKIEAALHYARSFEPEIKIAIADQEIIDAERIKGLLPGAKTIEVADA